MDWLEANGSLAFAAAILLGFLLATLWEHRRPLRDLTEPDRDRPLANFGLLIVSQVLQYVLVPLGAAFAAWVAASQGVGLLRGFSLPLWADTLLALVVLDALSWALHALMHHQAWLWQVHQVHHCDLDYDASLAFRFHPLEIGLHTLLSTALVASLGFSVQAVLLAGLIGNVHNVLVHANASLPPRLDALLNKLLVTPDWHRLHHSAVVAESQRNLGIVLTVWDRLFYTALPARSVARVGMDEWPDRHALGLWALLALPFRRPPR